MKVKNYAREFLGHKKFNLGLRSLLLASPLLLMLAGACAHFGPWTGPSSYNRCVDRIWMELQALPEKEHHQGLDGQDINLHYYSVYALTNYHAILPFKFYHWQNEVWEFQNPPHKSRVYFNIDSVCRNRKRFEPELGT
jgi:hypothetical protein